MASAPYVDPEHPSGFTPLGSDSLAVPSWLEYHALTHFHLSRSLKELTKAIHDYLPTATLPLPDGIVEIIERYLSKNEDKFDEHASEKLNDELLSIYKKNVASVPARYAAFIAILRCLRPLIGQPAQVLNWVEMLVPALDYLSQEKGLAAEIRNVVLDILLADHDNDTSSPTGGGAMRLAERIMILWFDECDAMRRITDPVQDTKERHLKETLMSYGKKHPKDFMTLVDQFICKKAHRANALLLLSQFVQSQPPHLYLILQTPLFGSLLKCLQWDTSTTIMSLALTALTMILPHVPSSLVPHLPTLFNIYARLLFWERGLATQIAADTKKERRMSHNTLVWAKCDYSPESDESSIPQLLNYFTILYGLYPINFMDYIRKPQRYLRHAEVPDADDIEVQPTEIRYASERFRQCHLLHENFYTLTIDSEKTDFGRWIKSEPAEVVANCVALCQFMEPTTDHGTLDFSHMSAPDRDVDEMDGHDDALLSSSFNIGMDLFSDAEGESPRDMKSPFAELTSANQSQSTMIRQPSQSSHKSNRDSTSTKPSGNGGESPTLVRSMATSGSHTQLQDLINSNKAVKSGLHQTLTNDSVPSLSLSHHDSISERPLSQLRPKVQAGNAPSSATDTSSGTEKMYRFILIMYNDLIFERFMKQQHLTHIGELRRRHVKEAASEAETQNLIIANRHLKQRLEDATNGKVRAKTEAEKSRTLAKKWEGDLLGKLKTLREEQRKWNAEGAALRTDLEAAKDEAEKLRKLLCEAEVRELGWKQNMQSVEISVGELERLRKEVARLTESERNYQAKEADRQAAMTRAAEADSRAEMLTMKLKACESDHQQTHDQYQSQVVVLNAKLQDALKGSAERRAENLKTQLDEALAASRAQQTELKKRVADLTSKNTALHASVLELQAAISIPARSKSDARLSTDPDVRLSAESGSPLSYRNRRGFSAFSDSENLEATSFNETPPLELFSTSRSASNTGRPSTSLGSEGISASKGSLTWQGDLANPRKDKKDKKDDKERKKSTGLRGIRGFGV
ncbi:Uu.00g017180.m01.CDS01 [Anthostomella pinea]|uniref:Uu.00g017180.m01.CDS01 n=1 Tax=Anthostomella pinea TaxID=933095 RepID=A0AAI8VYU4_9PEZI|nr:Uu.00g017180.m01.CDS01 [Anthostomella pinea]